MKTKAIDVASLTPADIRSVYYGRAGKCHCGCSGTYRYSSAHRAESSAARGYPVEDDEVSDRQVKRVLGIIQGDPSRCDAGATAVSLDTGGRVYIAYVVGRLRSE